MLVVEHPVDAWVKVIFTVVGVVLPVDIALTNPVELTVATPVLLLVQAPDPLLKEVVKP